MKERAGSHNIRRVSASLAAVGLLLAACGNDADPELPAGAEMPSDYRYQVIIGEELGQSVYVYTNTEPAIETRNRNTVVVIDGPAFCPPSGLNYGSEEVQATRRDNYCSGEGVYAEYAASVGNNRAAIIDRGGPVTLPPATSLG